MSEHFLLKEDEYKRDLNIVDAYQKDSALYLSRTTGKPFDTCLEYVRKTTNPGGKLGITDPEALVLSKEKPGNRSKMAIPFTEYLRDVVENQRLISPTMAVYLNPKEKKSLLATYISGNIKRRNSVKKEMFQASVAGDEDLEDFKKNEQTSFKTKNNSLSGAHASAYTILHNKSAHSTLTSTCRSATGYGNANNEKFLFGNRHYWCPDIVKANITSIINNTDLDFLTEAMDAYGIRHPTVEETMDCITYSTDLYWKSEVHLSIIERLVKSLKDIERSAFVYIGDMYHLAKYNDEVVRKFLDEMSTPVSTPIDNPDEYIDRMDDDLEALVKYLCIDEIQKRSMEDVKKEDPHAWGVVGATAKHIEGVVEKYAFLIKALWTTRNLPASIANLPTSVRRGALASDTDSTIFTVQYWTGWFVGQVDFSKKSCAIRDVIAYLTSKNISHVLAMMTTQMGVVQEQRHQLSMKNEYTFPVFSLTTRSKHYFAFMSAQEGNVFKEFELELKGVALRNSNSPKHVREKSRALIEMVMHNVIEGKGINASEVLGLVAGVENSIRDSILSGSCEYFKSGQIKSKDSYKNPDSSPYQHYLMWEEVFADKYGHTEPPTYSSVKVSVEGDNATKLKEWMDKIDDKVMVEKITSWLKANDKTAVTTLVLPAPIVKVKGVPEEIITGVNIRKLISDIMEPFYIVLESLGLYMKDDNLTKLVSDYYK